MRKIKLCAALISCSLAALGQESPDTATVDTVTRKGPVIEFERMEISDTLVVTASNTAILKSEKYKYAEFRFMNTGDEPLVITSVTQSAPCFSGEWPRQPIYPGEEGTIKVTCPAKPEGKEMVMGFTVITNDPSGIKLLVLKRTFINGK